MTRKKNPLVFLDVSVDGDPAERMVFELFTDVVPKTSENFRALCTGEKGIGPKTGKPLHYKGSFFHHIINGVMAQAGDFVKRDGTGGESIYGEKFPDEPFKLKHDDRGILSMPIADRDSHGSHFIVTFKPNHQLDRKSVVFGKLVDGSDVLAKMENVGNEDGTPSVTVKIINSGEYNEGKKKLSRGKHKKYHRERRKRRRKYYTSDSDSSSETDTESSDSDSDSSDSSSSYISSSSDERRRKRKRSSKRDKYRRGKRRDKRREKKHRKRDKRSKRLSKRASDSFTDAESKSESESSFKAHDTDVQGANPRGRNDLVAARRQSPSVGEKEVPSVYYRTGKSVDMPVKEDGVFPKENGGRRSNGIEAGNGNKSDNSADRQPDVVDDDPDKSRSHSRSMSPKRTMSKSMSISPRRSPSRSPSVSSKRSISRSPTVSPLQRSHRSRSLSRSVSGSPVRGKNERSISPLRGSPVRSLPRRSPSRSLPRTSSRRSVSRSSVRVGRMSVSRSPVRSSRRSLSRSSGRPRKSISGSPIRARSRNVRRSYSRSASPVRRVRSPDHERSPDRSVSPDDSSKRIRRGRGFSQRYSYARRYRTRSPDRSPARGYRYGGRGDRDRYSSYRRYSPRRNRSPPRGRTPPRYRGRRSRTRSQSASRSPVRHRSRNYSRSPVRRHSPVEVSRYHVSSRSERRRSPSRSRSPYRSRSSLDSESPRRASKDRSRSSSGSPVGKKGLVSYGDGSPDSGQR